MSSENWLTEEAKKAKQNTSDWPQWRKESVTSSKAYGYSEKPNLSCSDGTQSDLVQKPSK
jgi:hypothetical protein